MRCISLNNNFKMRLTKLFVCLSMILGGLRLVVVAQSDAPQSEAVKKEGVAKPEDSDAAEQGKEKRNIRFQFEGVEEVANVWV